MKGLDPHDPRPMLVIFAGFLLIAAWRALSSVTLAGVLALAEPLAPLAALTCCLPPVGGARVCAAACNARRVAATANLAPCANGSTVHSVTGVVPAPISCSSSG